MDEFKILKIKFNSESKSSHTLFYKQHNIKKDNGDNEKPTARTLFVLNIPSYCTEESLKNVFNTFGHVDSVYLNNKPTQNDKPNIKSSYFKNEQNQINCFKIAYIVFNNQHSLNKALNNPIDDIKFLSTKDKPIHTGLRKWISNYRNQFVDTKELQFEIDEYMRIHDLELEKKNASEKEKLNEPDEEGWITITKSSKKSGLIPTEKNIEKLKLKEKKKAKQKELLNFYSFQMRESKKEYIAKLRKMFEEDKKRIDLLKTNRKFKPF